MRQRVEVDLLEAYDLLDGLQARFRVRDVDGDVMFFMSESERRICFHPEWDVLGLAERQDLAVAMETAVVQWRKAQGGFKER